MKFLLNYIKSRLPLLLLVLCIISCAVASMVYAKYIHDKKEDASIDIIANGDLFLEVSGPTDNVCGEYTVTNQNTSTMPAYIRYAVVVNWIDGEGNFWAVPPTKDTDYTVTANNCTLLGEGSDLYYYYNGVRNIGEAFAVTVEAKGEGKPNYSLHVQILAEGIQTAPLSASGAAWGYVYENDAWREY